MTQVPPPQNGGFSPSRTWRRGVYKLVAIRVIRRGCGGCSPPRRWGLWSVKSNQHRPGRPGYGRGVVGGGAHARARPRKSAIFAFQDGKIPDSPPRKPALRGPRRRGVWGGSLLLPPPLFPGLLGPLEAAVGGLPGQGRTPDPDPGLPPTLWPHTFPSPRGPSPPASPCRVYAGIPGDPAQLHASHPPLQALPGPSPARR